MSDDKKTMTVEEARQSIIDAIECELDPIEWETKAKVDAAFDAVRNEADKRWRKAIAKEVQYQMYARSAIGESAVVALANVLEKMK